MRVTNTCFGHPDQTCDSRVSWPSTKRPEVRMLAPKRTKKMPRSLPAWLRGNPQNSFGRIPEQHFTQPPPRLSEASLVQALEENGIGRPSTYAPTISTIQQRGYVQRIEKRLAPTETGFQVNDLLVEYFPEVVDVKFTAHMEDDLDRVAAGEMDWTAALREFYEPFKELVRRAQAEIPITKTGPEPIGRLCPEDGGELVVRYGRYGRFISCANFPKCRYTEPWLEKIGVTCPKDGGDVVERKNPQGDGYSMAAPTTRHATSPLGDDPWPTRARIAVVCWSSRTSGSCNAPSASATLRRKMCYRNPHRSRPSVRTCIIRKRPGKTTRSA